MSKRFGAGKTVHVKVPTVKARKYEDPDKNQGYIVIPVEDVAKMASMAYNASLKKQRLAWRTAYAVVDKWIILIVYPLGRDPKTLTVSEEFIEWLRSLGGGEGGGGSG